MWPEVLAKIGFRWIDRPKTRIEVTTLRYELLRDSPSGIVVIVPCPSLYHTMIGFSHHGRPTTIKKVTLTINGNLTLEPRDFSPIRITDGDYIKKKLTFPIEENRAVRVGLFEMRAVDSDNHVRTCKGQFPITN